MNVCYLVGAGDCYLDGFCRDNTDLVIAVDGGFKSLADRGIEVDMVVGDFDSLLSIPDHKNVVMLKPEKDDTDMLAAIKIGLNKGHEKFCIYGATGGRLDHTIANIQCLIYLVNHGSHGQIVDKTHIITAIRNQKLRFEKGGSGVVSVFAFEPARGVNIRGLKYPLTDYLMLSDNPIGVSNQLLGEEAEIEVKDGVVIVIYPKYAKVF